MTNIHPATWSRGERGILDLRKWDYLAALSKAFDTTPADLIRKAAEEFIVDDITRSIEVDYRKARTKAASKKLSPRASELLKATERILRTGDERAIAELAAFAKGVLAGSRRAQVARKRMG